MKLTIKITRAEGPNTSLPASLEVNNFAAIRGMLSQWSNTAPKRGGYDKVDFRIDFTETELLDFHLKGRIDLHHWSVESPDEPLQSIRDQVVAFLQGRKNFCLETDPDPDSKFNLNFWNNLINQIRKYP